VLSAALLAVGAGLFPMYWNGVRVGLTLRRSTDLMNMAIFEPQIEMLFRIETGIF
jgi:hypothetical protein